MNSLVEEVVKLVSNGIEKLSIADARKITQEVIEELEVLLDGIPE